MRNLTFWFIAFVITISSAIYQRMTGPTYPIRDSVEIDNTQIKYKLGRSHGGETDHPVKINVPNPNISGYLMYKRYKTDDKWTRVDMTREDERLVAYLPHQPPAGKLLYKVFLTAGEVKISLSNDEPIIIRFKGDVPAWALIPHVLAMFLAMLVSNRAGIEALDRSRNPRKYALWAAGLLFIGGMILGPVVQKFAFGEFWAGIPFGFDLTDNKTLIAMLGWTAAIIAGRGGKPARVWVIAAAILLLAVYMIPHSMFGSEFDYSTGEVTQG
ncbi:hypothetical protein GF337_18705 [candidate division KSB1 bacterium]|nr:hypothetical protein [candidate division KSB1 bacterium]